MTQSDLAGPYIAAEAESGNPRTGWSDRIPGFWSLPAFLRVLLLTDGTVTRSLEAFFGEVIEIGVLAHCESTGQRVRTAIEVPPGDVVLERRVILRGKRTHAVYAFAASLIVLARIPEKVRRRLQEERAGIGELLCDCRLESYREILSVRTARAGAWGRELGVIEEANVAVRNYAIRIAARPAIEIEEVFPEAPFRC